MATLTCIICGVEFEGVTHARKTCPDCYMNQSKSLFQEEKRRRTKNKPNQRLYDDVKAATAAGLSYGKYMGRKNTNG